MGTAAMMSKDLFDNRMGGPVYNSLKNLIDDGVIHICGYVGDKNVPVYALCSRIGDPTGSPSIASKCACFRRCP